MGSLKHIKMKLSSLYQDFTTPNIKLEQYGTSIQVATNLIYRAMVLGDVNGKTILDLCSGPGILGITALLGGADHCTFVEIDNNVLQTLNKNLEKFGLEDRSNVVHIDALNFQGNYDTCVMNPPFGIQQNVGDKFFLLKALESAETVYSIHDASEKNLEFLPKYVREQGYIPTEYYIDKFPLQKTYSFHKKGIKNHQVMILRSITNPKV